MLTMVMVVVPLLAVCLTIGIASAVKVKIGFLVKQPEQNWFQLELKFARQAASERGFTLLPFGTPDVEKTLTAIDGLGQAGAQGFVVCTPDVTLGSVICAKAGMYDLKVLAVDDRFVGADGNEMRSVPYLGIDARQVGTEVGRALMGQVAARGWDPKEVGFCVLTHDHITTVRERTDAAVEVALGLGIPRSRIHKVPVKRMDIPSGMDAFITLFASHPDYKFWLVAGGNDDCVLGAVRAMESRGVPVENAVAVGVNGTDCIPEFERNRPTSFYGSVLLAVSEHGYRSAAMMYDWIAHKKEPPLDIRTTGRLITRDSFRPILREEGIAG